MQDLQRRSIEIILENQAPSGAYVASPNFPTYRYCWFRDGAFIAYAMDLAGEVDSARRFHDWAACAVTSRAALIERAICLAQDGKPLGPGDFLHTRYTLEGEDASADSWPNFQLDGFGTWLWALGEHRRLGGGPPSDEVRRAAVLVVDYLIALWPRPCYDCWEEFPDEVHPYTLAAIYAGIKSQAGSGEVDHTATLESLAAYVRQTAQVDGQFVKFPGSTIVDASLLGLATPYRLVDPQEAAMRATIARIQRSLVGSGGVHRYSTDTYFGGGQWVLLSGWLGWYYAEIGQPERSRALLDSMAAQADAQGYLPEQVPNDLIDPDHYRPWVRRWGQIARPLLWSHAMYLILDHNLKKHNA